MRHVQAVRERHAQQFADPAEAAASRSGRAWAWALGETTVAPVTGRSSAVPPSRPEIEAEIAVADGLRAGGDREGRADAAAAILRWLTGGDDHVPIRGENKGELVGGSGDVVRSREQIAEALDAVIDRWQRTAAQAQDFTVEPGDRQLAQQEADYCDGVVATLAWVLSERAETPITRVVSREPTTRNLKSERVHAGDVIAQASGLWARDKEPPLPPWYGEGVERSISWLLGDQVSSPTY